MRIKTTRFSEIEVPEDKVLRFPQGLIGFEEMKAFAVISRGDSPFVWLQSLDDPDLAFVVTDPGFFVEKYNPTIDQRSAAHIGISPRPSFPAEPVCGSGPTGSESPGGEGVRLLVIVTVPGEPTDATINLQAPIFVNERTMLGIQVVTMNPAYPLKYRLFGDGLAAKGRDSGAGPYP